MATFSEENGGLFRYEDFAAYTAKVETPVSIELSRLPGLQEPVRDPGPDGAVRAESPRRLRPEELGHNSPEYIHTSVEAVKLAMADREKYLGDTDFIKIPYRRPALEGLRARAPQAHRSRTRRRSNSGPARPTVHEQPSR